MATAIVTVPEFPGFSVEYDISKNPFFMPIVVENLRKIKSVKLGETLLRRIGRAQPRSRDSFPLGTNVMVKPMDAKFSQAGYAFMFGQAVPTDDPRYNPTLKNYNGGSPVKCPFCIVGGSANAAKDTTAAGDGTGSVCDLLFTNTQVVTSKGETTYPFLVMAHELIHSYHCLYGERKGNGDDEELKTTGLGRWSGRGHITENNFRSDFGIALRVDY